MYTAFNMLCFFRSCSKCGETLSPSELALHLQSLQKTGACPPKKRSRRKAARQPCPECNAFYADDNLAAHLAEAHPGTAARFQCSECEVKLISLQGCRKHYRYTEVCSWQDLEN